jgi:hypothetical protein
MAGRRSTDAGRRSPGVAAEDHQALVRFGTSLISHMRYHEVDNKA